MTYKIREFSLSFYYVDEGEKDFKQAIIDFVNTIPRRKGIQMNRLLLEIERGLPDARTPEEKAKDEAEERVLEEWADEAEVSARVD